MLTLIFLALVGLSMAVALVDWRRGWLLAVLVGVLQDPARKLTAGTPVVMTFSILAVYIIVLFGAQRVLQRSFSDATRRFPQIYLAGAVVLIFLILAAMNGLVTYGVAFWKVPALSLFIYLMPVPAVLLGYAYLQREEQVISFLRFYAFVTVPALIGTSLEYLNFKWQVLGMVGLPEGFIRFLPGLEVRILSGFYRAPDIMGWHAATLVMVGIIMALRTRDLRRSAPWILVAGWGFYNCIISGRRKAVYMVAVFGIAFVWRYVRRLTLGQLFSFGLTGVVMIGVVNKMSQSEESSVYTKAAVVSSEEVFGRLEGGFVGTVEQFGFMGAGLGTATQGVRHFLGHDENIGWQEGGLGKLAIELGLPGVLAVVLFGLVLMRLLLIISGSPDEPGSTQLIRAALFAMVVANVVNFMVSAQAYSDAVLTLMTAFCLGLLLGTPKLGDPSAEIEPADAALTPVLTARAEA